MGVFTVITASSGRIVSIVPAGRGLIAGIFGTFGVFLALYTLLAIAMGWFLYTVFEAGEIITEYFIICTITLIIVGLLPKKVIFDKLFKLTFFVHAYILSPLLLIYLLTGVMLWGEWYEFFQAIDKWTIKLWLLSCAAALYALSIPAISLVLGRILTIIINNLSISFFRGMRNALEIIARKGLRYYFRSTIKKYSNKTVYALKFAYYVPKRKIKDAFIKIGYQIKALFADVDKK